MIKGDIVSAEQCAIRKDYTANKRGLMSNFFKRQNQKLSSELKNRVEIYQKVEQKEHR